jgi:hypothetical protein
MGGVAAIDCRETETTIAGRSSIVVILGIGL